MSILNKPVLTMVKSPYNVFSNVHTFKSFDYLPTQINSLIKRNNINNLNLNKEFEKYLNQYMRGINNYWSDKPIPKKI